VRIPIASPAHAKLRAALPVAVIGAALLAVQIGGNAFHAEFTGYPDEAAHFVSALMIHDYLVSLPPGSPLDWAGQYYLHYPKVAIGHWPPLYHAMQALWYLPFGPSRTAAMMLQWAIGLAALTLLYRLCRTEMPAPLAAAAVAAAMATPVFQQSLGQVMAELTCLLWSVLFLSAALRFLGRPDRTSALLLVLPFLGAALTKGTAVCLAPVLVGTLAAGAAGRSIPWRWLAAGIATLAAAGLCLRIGSLRAWGGMSFGEPWHGEQIGHLAGWGLLGLAALGLRRTPLDGSSCPRRSWWSACGGCNISFASGRRRD